MAEMRVFVSSTCYDLSLLRSQLRIFIKDLGYEPIMSDYEDVLYDPRIHTHTGCVDEVGNCDVLVLIIGSRFGGKAVPEALSKIDFEVLKNESASVESLKETANLSVTQLEVLTAIEHSMPVYTFIDKRVWHDHALYEKNKSNSIAEKIVYPSIEKQETAKYIFEFINFVRLRTKGNSVFSFEKGQDIEDTLKKQWSGYFQRLLQEQRFNQNNHKRIDVLSEQFEDLKTAILSSIENVDQRAIAKSIVQYRKLSELLFGLRIPIKEIASSTLPFWDILKKNGIRTVVDARDVFDIRLYRVSPRSFLLMDDGTFFESRIPVYAFADFEQEWENFVEIAPKVKEIALEALNELVHPTSLVRYHRESFNEYIERRHSMRDPEREEE